MALSTCPCFSVGDKIDANIASIEALLPKQWRMSIEMGLTRLSPSPAVMERGKRCWKMRCWGAWGQIGRNCGAFAPYIFWIFSFLCLLRPGVEPDERVFKGVQCVHFTLGFVCIYDCRWWLANRSGTLGESPPDLLAIKALPALSTTLAPTDGRGASNHPLRILSQL